MHNYAAVRDSCEVLDEPFQSFRTPVDDRNKKSTDINSGYGLSGDPPVYDHSKSIPTNEYIDIRIVTYESNMTLNARGSESHDSKPFDSTVVLLFLIRILKLPTVKLSRIRLRSPPAQD